MRSIAERAAGLSAEQELVKELAELLRKLKFHHESQAKPGSSKCSAEYHLDLADRLDAALNGRVVRRPWGSHFKPRRRRR